MYTSAEAMWSQSEYIRDGMDFKQWHNNMIRLVEEGNLTGLHVMCTINALCLDSLPQFLDMLVDMKRKYGRDYPNFTLNILRFPSFQSAVVLPREIKQKAIKLINERAILYKDELHEHEYNQMNRLVNYLDSVDSPHSGADTLERLQQDFKKFYTQYDKRRGKTFEKTFSPEMVEWYVGI